MIYYSILIFLALITDISEGNSVNSYEDFDKSPRSARQQDDRFGEEEDLLMDDEANTDHIRFPDEIEIENGLKIYNEIILISLHKYKINFNPGTSKAIDSVMGRNTLQAVTKIELGIQSQLLASPGTTVQIYYEVTNLRDESTFHNFQVVDEKRFLRTLNPLS